MKTIQRSLAALELLLVFPAVLFMMSLVVRSLQPTVYEPAHTAQRIVDWYATHPPVGLFVLLIALPLAVLAIGSATLLREWRRNQAMRTATRQTFAFIRAYASTLLIAVTIATAVGILAIVAVHMAAD
jgi:ABC-type multidrug transport system permease subunit